MNTAVSSKNIDALQAESARTAHMRARQSHWDAVARELDRNPGWGAHYHRRIEQVHQTVVPPNQRVIEIGCGAGDLLAACKPSCGVGVDLSREMILRAARRHPNLSFIQADAHRLAVSGKFDVIILSDLINDLWDVQVVFKQIWRLSNPRTRVILSFYSRLWELPLAAAKRLGKARPTLGQNWLTVQDVRGLLSLSRFEVIKEWQEFIWPSRTPIIEPLLNRFLVRQWPLNHFALANFMLARPEPNGQPPARPPSVSVVIPARDEAGNIAELVSRVPNMGAATQLIFVEGHSSDGTFQAIQEVISDNPPLPCILLRQRGEGKGDAVRFGFARADGDILMILDADLTVAPEELPRFYEALITGKAEFANGVRLVYPVEGEAMRFLNLLANKAFSLAISWLLGQPVKDSLCGTKAFWSSDLVLMERTHAQAKWFDPFGDFELLFGAASLNLKIVDIPVRYAKRRYGSTNIRRWEHGWLLLRMLLLAASQIKFV